MRIKSITYAGKANVYNMEVQDTHSFSVEGGIIVHNCYDEVRYMCMENPITPKIPKITTKPYNPLDNGPVYDKYAFMRM